MRRASRAWWESRAPCEHRAGAAAPSRRRRAESREGFSNERVSPPETALLRPQLCMEKSPIATGGALAENNLPMPGPRVRRFLRFLQHSPFQARTRLVVRYCRTSTLGAECAQHAELEVDPIAGRPEHAMDPPRLRPTPSPDRSTFASVVDFCGVFPGGGRGYRRRSGPKTVLDSFPRRGMEPCPAGGGPGRRLVESSRSTSAAAGETGCLIVAHGKIRGSPAGFFAGLLRLPGSPVFGKGDSVRMDSGP